MEVVDAHRKLQEEIKKLGLPCVLDFQVKSLSGKQIIVDMYVPMPQRTFIEVLPINASNVNQINSAIERINAVKSAFRSEVLAILVVVFDKDKPPQPIQIPDPVVCLKFPTSLLTPDYPKIARRIVERVQLAGKFSAEWLLGEFTDINIHHADKLSKISRKICDIDTNIDILQDIPEYDQIFLYTLNKLGPFSDVLVNFHSCIPEQSVHELYDELLQFYNEYKSEHYTTAALCVGRTLELVIYTIARGWDVQINKYTNKTLNMLEEKFRLLEKSVINCAYSENENRLNELSTVRTRLKEFSDSVEKASNDLESPEFGNFSKKEIIKTQTILREIKRKYSGIEIVRITMKELEDGKEVANLLEKRNRAAHASATGDRIEFSKEDVDDMIESLRAILFSLGNVADSIAFATRDR